MTRKEYLHKLHSYLRNLPEEEVEDLLIYFEELFNEEGIEENDQVPAHYDSP